ILGQPAAERSPARVHGLPDDCVSSLYDGGHLPAQKGSDVVQTGLVERNPTVACGRRANIRETPECPRVTAVSIQAREMAICRSFAKPSDGLEPSTPSLPQREEGVDPCGFPRGDAAPSVSGVVAFRHVLHGRATLCDLRLDRSPKPLRLESSG